MVKQSFALSAGKRIDAAISYLPGGMRREILEIARSVLGFERRLSEIRIRRGGVSMLVVGGVSYPLIYRISDDEMRALVDELSGGAMYAHRDTVARGYIVASGMRIGISGLARYDGTEVGVGEFRAVVFRLQCAECNFAGDLYREWQESGGGNLLIAAPPLGGKTTALAHLSRIIGSGRAPKRAVIVDERCEFDPEMYRDCSVDVLQGYRRGIGIELAYRTLSAEVVVVDEITSRDDANALLGAYGAGVGIVSSIHAESLDDVYSRDCILELLGIRVFGHAAVITHIGSDFSYELFEL